jgi:RNA polymerase sigma-70 factor (ECF subfamily)
MAARVPVARPQAERLAHAEDRVVSLPLARLGEAELLAQLLEERPAAFQELFDRYAALIRGGLVRMIGADAEVDDLVQDVLLVVVRRCGTIRDPGALRSFVYSVALRIGKNELRKRAVRRWVPWSEAPRAVRTVQPHDPLAADAVRRVYAVLDRLDVDLRVSFVLRFVEGHELTEGARLCGCSLATFKRRVSRAETRFETLAARDPVLGAWLEGRTDP